MRFCRNDARGVAIICFDIIDYPDTVRDAMRTISSSSFIKQIEEW